MSAYDEVYDLDAISAEVHGNGDDLETVETVETVVLSRAEEADRIMDEVFAMSPEEVEAIVGRRPRRTHDYYQRWWLKRYTMDEIRWLGGTIDH